MKFINDDFMLHNDYAKKLYHDCAETLPIIDYHCHLSAREIAEDIHWENPAQIWLAGDHYKWRAMRTNGIDEELCTGAASDREKFDAWAATMPNLLRNPLYHWNQLELARYFDIFELLSPETADTIWHKCCQKLAQEDFSARNLMLKSNVTAICTTDDPTDALEHHIALASDSSFNIKVLPTWRPDKALAVDNPKVFNHWFDTLAKSSGIEIIDFDSFMVAIAKRHNFFHQVGCRLSDYGIDTAYAEEYTMYEIKTIFAEVLSGQKLTQEDIAKFKSAMLFELGLLDHAKDWVMQIHLGPLRNNNTRLFKKLGPDIGCDSIGDKPIAASLSKWLDRLDTENKLAKTILYNINPRDNALLASMIGNFQDGSVPGKIQFGSGWWFMDQEDGMRNQINSISRLALLSRFIGMLTDSRSFLSYTRHEYFRRILCNILGEDMQKGLIPQDFELVGKMVSNISYHNAKNYFNF